MLIIGSFTSSLFSSPSLGYIQKEEQKWLDMSQKEISHQTFLDSRSCRQGGLPKTISLGSMIFTGRPLIWTSPVRYFLANLDQFCPVFVRYFWPEDQSFTVVRYFQSFFGLVFRYFLVLFGLFCPVFFQENGLLSGILQQIWTRPQNRPVLNVRY